MKQEKNTSSLPVEMQLGNPSGKTSRIDQLGEVSLLTYFWKRWFPISFCRRRGAFLNHKPINKPAKNNKRILIAAVFHFVEPVQKEG